MVLKVAVIILYQITGLWIVTGYRCIKIAAIIRKIMLDTAHTLLLLFTANLPSLIERQSSLSSLCRRYTDQRQVSTIHVAGVQNSFSTCIADSITDLHADSSSIQQRLRSSGSPLVNNFISCCSYHYKWTSVTWRLPQLFMTSESTLMPTSPRWHPLHVPALLYCICSEAFADSFTYCSLFVSSVLSLNATQSGFKSYLLQGGCYFPSSPDRHLAPSYTISRMGPRAAASNCGRRHGGYTGWCGNENSHRGLVGEIISPLWVR